jgi:hypothetical protein
MDLDRFLNASEKWDAKYRKAVIAAIRQYQPDRAEDIIARYLSHERCAEFNWVNTYSRRIFRKELLKVALDRAENLFRPGIVVMLASITDFDWACCDRNIQFDLRSAKQKIRNAFTGMNFFGVIEPAYYPRVPWMRDDQIGCLISFHAHLIVWDTSASKLRRHQREIRQTFTPVGPDDRSTPKLNLLKELIDLMTVARYATKMPFEGYDKKRGGAGDVGAGDSVDPDSSSGSVTQIHTDLQPIHHYRLFRFMRKYRLFDAWLGGGGGSDLLRETRKASVRAARALRRAACTKC